MNTANAAVVLRIERDYSTPAPLPCDYYNAAVAPPPTQIPPILTESQAHALEQLDRPAGRELHEMTRGGYAECRRFSLAIFDSTSSTASSSFSTSSSNPQQASDSNTKDSGQATTITTTETIPAATATTAATVSADTTTNVAALQRYQIDLRRVREVVYQINRIYWEAERIGWPNFRDNLTKCCTCYLLPLAGWWRKRTYYAKWMRQLDRLITAENQSLFNPCGLQLIHPRLTGDLYLEIRELK